MQKQQAYNSYDLIWNPDRTFSLRSEYRILYHGKLKDCVTYMVNRLDFNIDEIIAAIDQMETEIYTRAHFGIFKTFIFADTGNQKGVA